MCQSHSLWSVWSVSVIRLLPPSRGAPFWVAISGSLIAFIWKCVSGAMWRDANAWMCKRECSAGMPSYSLEVRMQVIKWRNTKWIAKWIANLMSIEFFQRNARGNAIRSKIIAQKDLPAAACWRCQADDRRLQFETFKLLLLKSLNSDSILSHWVSVSIYCL